MEEGDHKLKDAGNLGKARKGKEMESTLKASVKNCIMIDTLISDFWPQHCKKGTLCCLATKFFTISKLSQ
jgi:hypothetical protein